jgi:predicted nicotinamide N-methyase
VRVIDLVEDTVALGTRELNVLRPRDPEVLLDEDAFEHEEFLPYWAELWPSGLALAHHVAALQLKGARVAELGCGLAIPSFAAALAGARVFATDWSPDAIELARQNAERNGIELELAVAGWTRPGPLLERAPFDLLLASDVLYERRNIPLLLYNVRRLAPELLLADPRRPHSAEFLEGAARDWEIESSVLSDSPLVNLHRLRARSL